MDEFIPYLIVLLINHFLCHKVYFPFLVAVLRNWSCRAWKVIVGEEIEIVGIRETQNDMYGRRNVRKLLMKVKLGIMLVCF